MTIQKLRVDKGWSQEELAAHSGLSVRTIQRIENGKRASLESLKCLAAVFETHVSDLIQENPMNDTPTSNQYFLDQSEQDAIDYVDNLRAFHMNWITFLIVMPFMYWLNIKLTPGFLWVLILAGTWILAIVLQAVLIFGLFSEFSGAWEQRQFQKRMSRHDR
jgi:transcriptional regulator with XRE-family HTH domain